MSTEDRVKEVFCSIMDITSDELPEDATPDTIESWDSIRHLKLVLALEEEFDIELDEDEVDGLLSVSQFVQAIEAEL